MDKVMRAQRLTVFPERGNSPIRMKEATKYLVCSLGSEQADFAGVGKEDVQANKIMVCWALLLVEFRSPPKKYVEILTPQTRKCDLIWKEDFCRYKQVKMRSY